MPPKSTSAPRKKNKRKTGPGRPPKDSEQRSQELRPGKARPPRLDARHRALSRFYEPLVLLRTLGQTRGPHINPSSVRNHQLATCSDVQLRHQFLNDLAYCCDYDKGGTTVTAIAVQTTPQGLIYYVSSNENPKKKICGFLQKLMHRLRVYDQTYTEQMEEIVVSQCVEFARPRIRQYWNLLRTELRRLDSDWEGQGDNVYSELLSWKQSIERAHDDGDSSLCRLAYLSTSCAALRAEEKYPDARETVPKHSRTVYESIKHYAGRLGYHFRAAKTFSATRKRLAYLFEDFEIKAVDAPPTSTSPPKPDERTTLNDIVVRMLPANDQERVQLYQSVLALMDAKFQITKRYMDHYTSPTFQPRVHAELILLEMFSTKKLQFLEDDKFIGCSKPACYCCHLYIQCHPGNFVEPASHQKIYLNWRAPDQCQGMPKGHQQNMFNLMIARIRSAVFQHLEKQTSSLGWHPDSTTGATDLSSVRRAYDAHNLEGRSYAVSVLSLSRRAGSPTESLQADEHIDHTPKSESEDSWDGGVMLELA